MNHTSHVAIPERMRHLDRDPRGYPIPFMVWRDDEGRAHFTINDEHKRQKIIAEDRCSICCQPLLRGRWFVGGPGSAFHRNGAYLDPPMHDECAHYALAVCPYLAAPHYGKRIDDRTLQPDATPPIMLVEHEMDINRPALFVAVMATGQRNIRDHVEAGGIAIPVIRFVKPKMPYLRIEYWCAGEKVTLSADEERALIFRAMDDPP